MKKLLSVLSVFALAAIAAGTASAGSIATPTGLNPGDQFRIVFLTFPASATLPTSSNLSTYDNIVSSDATGYTYGGKSPIWKAIVSSAGIDAKDHIGLQSTSVVPLYTVSGTKVSGGNLWSGALLNQINVQIDGSLSPAGVWTGTSEYGTGATLHTMGSQSVRYGIPAAVDSYWISQGNSSSGIPRCLYGISEVLTVPSAVPEPSTVMLVGLGGLAALGYSFKRKRN